MQLYVFVYQIFVDLSFAKLCIEDGIQRLMEKAFFTFQTNAFQCNSKFWKISRWNNMGSQ